jgi:hypothetical protein
MNRFDDNDEIIGSKKGKKGKKDKKFLHLLFFLPFLLPVTFQFASQRFYGSSR